MLKLGTVIVSTYDAKVTGPIVGYGVINWPTVVYGCNGDEKPRAAYLVQVAEGSSSLGPACRVIACDSAREVQ